MGLDYKSFLDIADKDARKRNESVQRLLQQGVARGDRASALIADSNWAWVIKEYEEARDAALTRAEALRAQVLSPSVVNADEFNLLKIQLVEAETVARTWQQAIDAPQRAIDTKTKAESQLKDMAGAGVNQKTA